MSKLSAIVIAKNAEDMITDCFRSVSFCDEIVVVDGGSSDKTNEIAEQHGAKVVKGAIDSFAQQRNIGLQSAMGEWVLYIDTDERVSDALASEIKLRITNNELQKEKFVAFKLRRKNFYLGQHEWPQIELLERVFKKDALKKWQGRLHESPVVDGPIGELAGYLYHYTHRDLSSMLQKTILWSQVEADLRFRQHHPHMTWWRFPRVMVTAFWDSYVKQQGYKAGTMGIIESIYQAFSMFITYARLWEMQQKSNVIASVEKQSL